MMPPVDIVSRLCCAARLAVLVAVPLACRFDPSGIAASDALPGDLDAAVDAPIDAIVPCWLYDPAHFDPCDLPEPTGPLEITAGEHVYDTEARSFLAPSDLPVLPSQIVQQSDGTEALLVSVTGVDIAAAGRLSIQGSRPIILAARDAVVIAGAMDVGSYRAGASGAGANAAACVAAQTGVSNASGGGGGGGGGFQGQGGIGGTGNSGASGGGAGGDAVAVPATVRGGCPGASGAGGSGSAPPAGGSGGGAVQITSQVSITVPGRLLAGGSGGHGAPTVRNGGGGSGSGGYIGLDAPAITLTGATLAANGGGGGEGSGGTYAGAAGSDGHPDIMAAEGGTGDSATGGDGGNGSTGATLDGNPGLPSSGGGGAGGGGAGYIIVRTPDLAGAPQVASPPITRQMP